ncbi:MAG: Glutathione peroxidase [Acidobacteriaceae bacterium]|nr:Glutathione peroxidase [Acidobacteriaceae bacterium]
MFKLSGMIALSAYALLASSGTHSLFAEAKSAGAIQGVWQGFATVRGTQQVPVTIRISGTGANLKAVFLNGPAADPVVTPASSVTFDGTHLVAQFDYFARKFDAVLADGTLTGTYGAAAVSTSLRSNTPTPITLTSVGKATDPVSSQNAPDIHGSWEIATKSNKGESAWEFRVDPPTRRSAVIKTVIQRIDGDTGGLWGTWNGSAYTVGHFNAAGPALYSVAPQPDGTLLIKSLLGGVHGSATDLIAQRSAEARKQNLPTPTDSTQQTTVKDPSVPFTFSFPDLKGKVVSNTDPEFRGKVVIVAIGGSWCPNCHDEAPFLVSLYKKYHSRGLEIVNLDFEQGDPETDTKRLNAFIAHYGITYPVLVGGTTDQLAEKIPQGVNLNCWPTSFFLGRDGRVKQTHAGFAGPGNTAGHEALEHEVTALVEKLLAEPASPQAASLTK